MKKIEKILRFIENQELNNSSFEKKVGISNGYIANMVKSGSEVSPAMWRRVLKAFPEIEKIEDLDSNRTPTRPLRDAIDIGAFSEDDPTEVSRGKEYIDLGNGFYQLKVPLVPHIASMGYLHGYADPQWLEELPNHVITVPFIPRGVYRAFVARGDSMDDGSKNSISTGDTVTGRVIIRDYWKSKLHLHRFRYFIIVHREGITIKEIINHDVEKGTITIHSLNPDKQAYPDQVFELKDVLQLLNVIKVERNFG